MSVSLPSSFLEQSRAFLGADETDALAKALQGEAPVSIRLNVQKSCNHVPQGEPVPWCASGSYLPERPSFTFDPLFHAGAYYVQEASSMFLDFVLRHYVGSSPVRMLDLCAAPGGKSTLAIDSLPVGSLLVANEVVRNRAQVLAENLTKWGHPSVVVTHNDPADFTPLGPVFDLILVDAPCSGEGMFRKDPLAVSEWSAEHVELCARRQRRILADIYPCLKPGGLLIYSTCTYNIKENEENVRWMREEWGMEVLPVPDVPAEWGLTGNLLDGEHFPVYRFLPHRTRGEGFFLAVLRKPGEEDEEEGAAAFSRSGKRKGRGPARTQPLAKEQAASLSAWLARPDEYALLPQGAGFAAFPRAWVPLLEALRASLRIIQAGVSLAEAKGRDLLPAHALAVSTVLHPEAFPRVEVDAPTAIAYLRREAVSLPADAPRGHVLLAFEGLPLGFVKNIGNRANNLYPQEWRIRKAFA